MFCPEEYVTIPETRFEIWNIGIDLFDHGKIKIDYSANKKDSDPEKVFHDLIVAFEGWAIAKFC